MKKAQAALEFLTTYSWALLIIAVMIGSIVYFGVVNPTSFIKERCFVSLDLYCVDSIVYTDGVVKFRLQNQLQDPISELNVTCQHVSAQGQPSISLADNTLSVPSGQYVEVLCDPKDGASINYNKGSMVKIKVSGYYKTASANDVYPNYFEGEIIAKVVEAPSTQTGYGTGSRFIVY